MVDQASPDTSRIADAVVVIPMHNEGTVVGEVVADVLNHFTHVVCVDDGSRDESGAVARAAGATVVTHSVNLGQGAALETGVAFALRRPGVRFLVTFDADGQHRPDDAAAMVRHAREHDVQVVLGSRFLGSTAGASRGRKLLLRGAVRFTRWTTGLDLSDAHNGLRVLRRDAAVIVKLRLTGMSHASEILTLIGRHRLSYAEYPVHIEYTEYSRSKGQKPYNALNIVFELIINRLRVAS